MSVWTLDGYIRIDTRQSAEVYVVDARTTFLVRDCPYCQAPPARIKKSGLQMCRFLDVPIEKKCVSIRVKRQRFCCKACGRMFSASLPHVSEHRMITERLVCYIYEQALKRSFDDIAAEVGISHQTARCVFREFVSTWSKRRQIQCPEWLEIDELEISNRMRCFVGDVRGKKVLDLLLNCDEGLLNECFKQFTGIERIGTVTINFWPSGRQIVRECLPNARIVVDARHILRMVDSATDLVYDECSVFMDRDRRGPRNCRFQLHKRRRDLTDRELQNVEVWKKRIPELSMVYDCRESFYSIWDEVRTPDEASHLYTGWQAGVPDCLMYAFENINSTVDDWHDEIFAYFGLPAIHCYREFLEDVARIAQRIGPHCSYEVVRGRILTGLAK